MAAAKKLAKKIPDKQLSIGRQRRQNIRVLRKKVRSCEKRLDTFSAQKSSIEIKMTAPGF
jgi:hypothetical protein